MKLNDYLKIGDTMKAMRLKKGLSQKEMAQTLGIAYTTYSNYENNNRTPDMNTLKKIADVLCININDFFVPGTDNDIYFEFLDLFIDWAYSRGYEYNDNCFDEASFIKNCGQCAYIKDNKNLYTFKPDELRKCHLFLYELFDILLESKKNESCKDTEE